MAYLTKLQREVAERLERGATMSELLEEGVVSPLTVRKWDVDDVVRRYVLDAIRAPASEEGPGDEAVAELRGLLQVVGA